MPVRTVIVDGETHKFHGDTLAEKMMLLLIDNVKRRHTPFSISEASVKLREFLGSGNVDDVLTYRALAAPTIELLYDLMHNAPDALRTALRSFEVPSRSREIVRVPRVLEGLAEIASNDRGLAVGKGEILFCLMFRNVLGQPNARYDVFASGIPWHIKDHRNCDSTPLGRPSDSERGNDWRHADVFRFIWEELGASFNFGNTFFEGRRDLEPMLTVRYGLPLEVAASRLEAELDEAMRDSPLFGDAPGIIFLKRDKDGLYFERLDKQDLHFHSVSNEGIKVSEIGGRFVEKVMHAQDQERKERELKLERAKRQAEKDAKREARDAKRKEKRASALLKRRARLEKAYLVEIAREVKARLRAQERIQREERYQIAMVDKQIMLDAMRHTEAIRFQRAWDAASSVASLAKSLGVTSETVRSRRKRYERKYGLKFKTHARVYRAVAEVSRRASKSTAVGGKQ